MENTETTQEAKVRATLHNIFWRLEIKIQPTEYNTVLADMRVDSLDFVYLIMETEREFKIQISNKEMDTTSTFNDLKQPNLPATSNQKPATTTNEKAKFFNLHIYHAAYSNVVAGIGAVRFYNRRVQG